MTATEFRAWLDANFPEHDQRGRPIKGWAPALVAAARFLGITCRSVQRKAIGAQPITPRDEILIARHNGEPQRKARLLFATQADAIAYKQAFGLDGYLAVPYLDVWALKHIHGMRWPEVD